MTKTMRIAVLCSLICLAPGMRSTVCASAASKTVAPVSPLMAETIIGMKESLTRVTGHAFKTDVQVQTLTETQVKAFLLEKLKRDYPDEKIAKEQKTYVHFGFLQPGEDLKGLFVQMLAEQAAGFYDPDDKSLYLVAGRPLPGTALVHELAHALQDQTFDVMAVLDRVRDNDDALLAAQSMIEGEAMVLSDLYISMRPGGEDPLEKQASLSTEPAHSAQKVSEATRTIPEILQANLMFPYTQGMTWAGEVVQTGGQRMMDSMFRRPPESTEQILHPQKVQSPRDVPSEIHRDVLMRLAPALSAAGYQEVKINTLGEFNILQLFGGRSDPGAVDAADGWDGDLFEIVDNAAGGTAMIWISVWDSPEDAAAFRARATAWLGSRHPEARRWTDGPAGQPGRIVWLLEGFDPVLAGTLAASLAEALPDGAGPARGVTFR